MKLTELYESNDDQLYDIDSDERTYELEDTRKPKLTLRHLNKLRKYRVFKTSQDAERDNIVSVVYAAPPDAGGGGDMGGF